MSDFLANLANRALGRAPTLERRRPSIFEPPAFAARHALAEATYDEGKRGLVAEAIARPRRDRDRLSSAEPASTPEPEAVDRDVALSSPPTRTRASSKHAEPAVEATDSGDLSTIVDAPQSPIGSRARALARPIEHDGERPEPSTHDRPTTDGETRSLRASRRTERLLATGEPVADDAGLGVIRASDDALDVTAIRERRADRGVEARPNERRAARQPAPRDANDEQTGGYTMREHESAPLRPALVALARATTAATRRAHGDAPAAPAAEQTVHVSIGRIEVRATPAPAPPRKAPLAPTTALSLDDYLRSRGGERR